MTLADEAANIISVRPELAREIARLWLERRRIDRRVGLTTRQRDTLDFIEAYAAEHDQLAPSFDEIADHLRTHKSGVHRLVTALEERGYIVRMPHRARSILLVGMV